MKQKQESDLIFELFFHNAFRDMRGLSITLWIIGILHLLMGFLYIFLMDLGIEMSKTFNDLCIVSVWFGSALIILRLVWGCCLVYDYEITKTKKEPIKKLIKQENKEK